MLNNKHKSIRQQCIDRIEAGEDPYEVIASYDFTPLRERSFIFQLKKKGYIKEEETE